MPNTLSELSMAYSVIWVILFFLIVKMGLDISRLEKKLTNTQIKDSDDNK